mmetsp:Transcript_64955/g.107653  ORF Transcript_64955/g.107653 Transcript_64955/m.107653 type:complete len:120 (+) Transcript_64955:2-361(+)
MKLEVGVRCWIVKRNGSHQMGELKSLKSLMSRLKCKVGARRIRATKQLKHVQLARRRLASTNRDASVNVQAMTGDVEGRGVECQVLDQSSNFFWLAEATKGNILQLQVYDLLRKLCCHV